MTFLQWSWLVLRAPPGSKRWAMRPANHSFLPTASPAQAPRFTPIYAPDPARQADTLRRLLFAPPSTANATKDERHPFPAKVEDDALKPATIPPAPRSIAQR